MPELKDVWLPDLRAQVWREVPDEHVGRVLAVIKGAAISARLQQPLHKLPPVRIF